MISPVDGFGMLEKWKTQNARLWFLVSLPDVANGPDVQVTSVEPTRLVLAIEGSPEPLRFELAGAKFEELTTDECPMPDSVMRGIVRFLRVSLADESKFLLAERVLD